MLTNRLLGGAAMAALAFAMNSPVLAQQLTSGIRGDVVTADGSPIAGAQVEVLDTRTGAKSTATTGEAGGFTVTNLEIGGPYTVTVTTDQFGAQKLENIHLALGDTPRIRVAMAAAEEQVLVLGARAPEAIETRGVSTRITAEEIKAVPTIARDFKDIVATSPLAYQQLAADSTTRSQSPISIAGANPRCNTFLVDGVPVNDNFGLNSTGYPTARAPMPVDWAEQIEVAVTPYDVAYNDFCGGIINVVTQSGSNELHGSAYGYYTDQRWGGRKTQSDSLYGPASGVYNKTDYEEFNYGMSLSGPIIEDTLFFFVGYDYTERTTPVSVGPQGSNAASTVNAVTQADLDDVRAISIANYGFDPLTLQNSFTEENERYMVKIGWNITDNHRVIGVYQNADGGQLEVNGVSPSASAPQLSLPSNWYLDAENLETYNIQAYSDWTDRFSTQFYIGRLDVVGLQSSLAGTDFPEIFVRTDGVDNTLGNGDDGYVRIGPDQFRHANYLEYRLDQIKLSGTYDLDEHVIKAGYDRRMLDIYNLFVQGSNMVLRFDSIADFENGILASGNDTRLTSGRGREPIFYSNAPSGIPGDGAADWGYDIDTLYVQDDWYPTDNLSITAGLRFEYFTTEGTIPENEIFTRRYGFDNTGDLDGLNILLPRASFAYDMFWEESGWPEAATLRGGVGRFSGGGPRVWVSNNYQNTGTLITDIRGTPGAGVFAGIPADFIAQPPVNFDVSDVPASIQALLTAASGLGEVNALDPDFELPSMWRANIGMDVDFGFGLRMAFDAIYMKGQDQLRWRDLRYAPTGALAPDGRRMFAFRQQATFDDPTAPAITDGSDLLLTNADVGESKIFTAVVKQQWEGTFRDIGFTFGYAYSDVTDMGYGTSSTAISNFRFRGFTDYDAVEEGRSDYERRHRFTLGMTWAERLFEGLETRFSLFGQRTSGQPYSYTFNGSPFGGNASGQSLFYVPRVDPGTGLVTTTSDSLVTYGDDFNIGQFNDYLIATGLIDYAGQIAPRNEFFSPWTTRFDLNVEQEVALFDDHKVIVEMNIFNLGNLLNKNWGRYEAPSFTGGVARTVLTPTIAGGKYNYGTSAPSLSASSLSPVDDRYPASVWQVSAGIRYEF